MKSDSSRLLLCTLATAVAVTAGDALAFPNPFKRKDLDTAPAPAEMRAVDQEAGAMIRQGEELETAGKAGAAEKVYAKVVEKHPLSSLAPTAQFRVAALQERDGKYRKSFDSYQTLIDTYRQSAQFGEAIDRQVGIAMASRTDKTGTFLGIRKKMDPSVVLEMFQKIIANAPRGKRAAEAQMEIARIHEEEGEQDAAIVAYRRVVEEYPASTFAAEAQTKVSQGFVTKVQEGSRDASNLNKAQEAADQAASLFPDSSLSGVDTARAEMNDLAAESAWNTGKFYEKAGNHRAAVIYYSELLKSPGNPHFEEAKERVNNMTARDPKLLSSVPALSVNTETLAVRAAVDLKSRPNYFGPPPPPARVANLLRKPTMRAGDQIPITPIEEPDLPTGTENMPRPDDTLLNPGDAIPNTPAPPEPLPALEPPTLPPPSEPTLPPPSEPTPPQDSPVPPSPAN